MGAGIRENRTHAVVPKQKSLNEEESEKVTREPDYSFNPLRNVIVNCPFSQGARLCTVYLYSLIFLCVFVVAENSNLRRIKINLI